MSAVFVLLALVGMAAIGWLLARALDLLDEMEREERMDGMKTCVYCGEPANTREHVRPRFFGGRKTVPACFHCNVVLGAYPDFTIEGRRIVVIGRLLKRLNCLRRVEWSESELSKLGESLRVRVRRLEQRRRWLERRVAYAKALAGMEQDQPVVTVQVEAADVAEQEPARNPFPDPSADRARWDLTYARTIRDAKYPRCIACGYPIRRTFGVVIHPTCEKSRAVKQLVFQQPTATQRQQPDSLYARLLRASIEGPEDG